MSTEGAPKAKPVPNDIRDTIDELLREIGSQVSTDPETFPAAKLELLERLQKLDAALEQSRSRSRSPRLKLLVAGLAIIAAFSYLLGPLSETRTDINGTATELVLTVDHSVALFDDTSVESVSCDGIDESSLGDAPPDESTTTTRAISVSLANGASQKGSQPPSVTLQALPVSPHSIVTISRNPAEKSLRISAVSGDGNMLEAVIAFEGAVRVSGVKSPASFATPQLFTLRGRSFVVNFAPKQPFSLRRSLAVHGLSFEDPTTRSNGPGEPASTIVEGSILFGDLGSAQKPLHLGQSLRVVQGRGLLRNLDVTGKGLQFDFSGVANDIRDGFDDNAPTLMPSRLEWIRGNPRVSLLWAALA